MTAHEVNAFFDQYVSGYILADIEREIAWAKSSQTVATPKRTYSGAGNYLCALGLLCYTEFMGAILLNTFSESSHHLFNACFALLGKDYDAFDQLLSREPSFNDPNKPLSVYEVFRCGMAHEYFIKKSGVIFMLGGNIHMAATTDIDRPTLHPAPSMLIGPVSSGLGRLEDGRYYFIVEKYYEDFSNACNLIRQTILSRPDPTIPEA